MSLISTEWLEKNLFNVKIIDGSWHMPATKRSGREEFNKEHIPNAIFFDIDENCNKSTDLPHMLTDISSWENILSSMGISNEDEIVIYDNSDVLSACRVWFNLIYFGHDKKKVHVLDGGFNKWKKEKRITSAISLGEASRPSGVRLIRFFSSNLPLLIRSATIGAVSYTHLRAHETP